MAKKVHVIPHKDRWATHRDGNDRASKVFDKKSDAIEHGRKNAKGERTDLVVHSKTGKILGKSSYGGKSDTSKVGTSGTGAKK